jgi:biotin carboxyl carrier protein
MNVEVAVNGRLWRVAVEPGTQAGEFAVVVGGATRMVSASWIDADTLSLIEGSSSHEVRFDVGGDGVLGVAFDRTRFEAVLRQSRLKPRPTDSGIGAPVGDFSAGNVPAGRAIIKSPMPGRVARVLVGVGDRVAARQGVVVVEAMKMENELRAPRDGVVTEVNVFQGAAIEAGAVLVVIE